MAFNLDSYLGVHTAAVNMRAQKAGLMANNLANADTPGFKARDVNFADALKQVSPDSQNGSGQLQAKRTGSSTFGATHPAHISTDEPGNFDVLYRVPTQPSLDGNTVQTDVEQSLFTENAIHYQASLQFLNSKIKGLIQTLRGE